MDKLAALLQSSEWVERRVDRVEFLDLVTVRRTITLTFDLGNLRTIDRDATHLIPLGWFTPWANAEVRLTDADGRVLPYLTSEASDCKVRELICERLATLGLGDLALTTLDRISAHRANPGLPGAGCKCCRVIADMKYVELMSDKWGCRSLLKPLELIRRAGSEQPDEARALARILLAWQTNFVLFVDLGSSSVEGDRRIVELSYDEEVKPWERPWERRLRVLGGSCLPSAQDRRCRRHISRGGPFVRDLDDLLPRGIRGRMAASRWSYLRHRSQRALGVAWHVAWHQASGLDVPYHQVDVILPAELTAVRMRMVRTRRGCRSATLADQVGARATIVAPTPAIESTGDCDTSNGMKCQCVANVHPPAAREHSGGCGGSAPTAADGSEGGWSSPTLFSLVITQRNPSTWYGGLWLALLTSLAILAGATFWLRPIVRDAGIAATILIVAPTLVASLLSFRAASDIADELTLVLRWLLGALGVLTALCAAALAVEHVRHGGDGRIPDIDSVRAVWLSAGGAQLIIASVLWAGAHRIHSLITWGRRASSRDIENPYPGEVLNSRQGSTPQSPRIDAPDRWLQAAEGDLVPWGWLSAPPDRPTNSVQDRSYWGECECERTCLVAWVQELFAYREPPDLPPACEECCC